MTLEEIEARLDVGCATDDDMAYLVDRVRKLERAHAWLAEEASFDCSEWGCTTDKGVIAKQYNEDTEEYEHNDGCKYVLARELKL